MSKSHIKKGDIVMVNAGDDKGKIGRVLKVLVKKQRAIIEGLNVISKHTEPNTQNLQGAIPNMEAPTHISNLNVLDFQSGKGTCIGRRHDDNGKPVRFAKKSGEVIKRLWH